MTTKEFIQKEFGNANGVEKTCSSVVKDSDGNIYSYGYHYPLLFTVGGKAYRNTRGYSNTTQRHILWSRGVDAIDVELHPSDRLWDLTEKVLAERLVEMSAKKTQELASKKRKNTQVYGLILRELERINESILKHAGVVTI